MASGHRKDPREIRAESVAERAKNGEYAKLGDYSVRKMGNGERLIKLHDLLVDNSDVEPGEDDAAVFGSLTEGIAIIDFEGRIEHE